MLHMAISKSRVAHQHQRPSEDFGRENRRSAGADGGEIRRSDGGPAIPVKAPDPERVAATLARLEELARQRDPAEDDAFLATFGEVDPTNWSDEAVEELIAERKKL